jgi:RNA polymerase sigma-70 factor (ECF subfamily)
MIANVTKLDARATDGALVTAAQAGDIAAKEALFRRHVGFVSGLAYRLLGRDTELEDVIQESFTVAFASLSKLARPQAFASWLATIVTGTTIATIRRRRMLARFGLLRQDPVQLEALIAKTAPPDVAAELSAVYGIIDTLPTKERVVLILRRVEEYSLQEIVEQTGWSLAAVKRRLANAESLLDAPPRPRREDT